VSPSPSPDALTTVENARLLLSRSSSTSPPERDRLQLLINAYSRQIRLYTGRQFVPGEDGAAKKFRYEGSGNLSLSPWELRSVTSVTLYTDLPQTGWHPLLEQAVDVESEFRLEPRQQTIDGTYLWMVLPLIGMYSPLVPEPLITRRDRGHQVTVVGDWGVGSVPGDVELACMIAVANAHRNPAAFQSMATGGIQFTEPIEAGDSAGMALPKDARALLSAYKRTAYG
jgi:hypothetical protein